VSKGSCQEEEAVADTQLERKLEAATKECGGGMNLKIESKISAKKVDGLWAESTE
jgi:hypothetical protein